MNTTVAVLINLLEGTHDVTTRLLDVIERKRKALVRLRMDELQLLSREEENLMDALVDLDAERVLLASEAAEELGLRRDATILEIADAAGDDAGSRLVELRLRLRAAAEQLSRSTKLTARLAEKSVNFFGQMVRTLAAAGMVNPTYTQKGIASAPRGRTLVDQTA